jgi:hypothetical protein
MTMIYPDISIATTGNELFGMVDGVLSEFGLNDEPLSWGELADDLSEPENIDGHEKLVDFLTKAESLWFEL